MLDSIKNEVTQDPDDGADPQPPRSWQQVEEPRGADERAVPARRLQRRQATAPRRRSADEGDVAVAEQPQPFVRAGQKVGRNDPCPCGSGKKYKQCHGKLT